MLLRILIPIVILCIGALAAWRAGIPVEEPKPEPSAPQVLKTEILELQRTDFQVMLNSQGTVRAHFTTTLTPQVAGTISTVSANFEDGAFFKKDDILAELDPADFKVAVSAAESGLARAQAALIQEEARAKQARLNWDDLGYEEEPSDLVLRIPQMKEAKANVDAAQADLEQALRNLDRTKIRAPFDGRVQKRVIGLGQAVGSSTPLGEIFATDFAEIRLPLSPRQLPFVRLPSKEGDPELKVTLRDALAGTDSQGWDAKIVRTEGALDEASRELFAIARIDDPFGVESGKRPLLIGQPVRATIQGVMLEDVFVLPRHALRGVNRIYLVDKLQPTIVRNQIEPVWSDEQVLVVRDGLEVGQWLSVTRLPYAPDGAPVEIVKPGTEAASAAESAAEKPVRAGS
ncbi:efflux RND transporter periplasmic adaptor subunit [Luteolibacter sp. GHJ8]|uniref:Efflux RND transporter periplasmic adaptor subunit n=1 Tax=Luteolibacter rhizosphaerae TaxID=2989719 RepID=A0ABT3G4Q1_9BACT|nr:efflux RND transporter periplasmic adaptor subunit [Luteolibacter rhizosphaerae]MCW1914195.1 efflux RND transporter periplasmic adaptor subunit [Luteolibacter rhizosphaerae]